MGGRLNEAGRPFGVLGVEAVVRRAGEVGFDVAGVTAAVGADGGRVTGERFAEWVELGRAGEMEYLKRRDEQGELLRRSVRVAIPWARSVVVCGMNYQAAGPRSVDPAERDQGWIARYAWNGREDGSPTDYHVDLMGRLRAVEATLREQAGLVDPEGCETRCYVDTGPVLERDLAQRAGVGWVGKNTCVLNQELGSWMLYGVIVTSLELEEGFTVAEAADRCGSCTRCIDACPTDALVAPRQMDASLCIAYLTIEHKGAIREELREAMGRQVFGCDICQDVCPWNRRAPVAVKEGLRTREELVNPDLEWLGGMEQEEFRARFRGSPLERTKLRRLRRNVAIAMGNSGEESFRPRLEEWAKGEDEVLADAAEWALGRLARSGE